MNVKLKSWFFVLCLFLLSHVDVFAQDKYEYAVLNYTPRFRDLEVSINGTSYEKIPVSKDKVKSDGDVNAALAEINKMTSDGWELFNTDCTALNATNSTFYVYVFYLRKKK